MTTAERPAATVDDLHARATSEFGHWELVKDVIDECIDLALNYRQSGHPGGSRSKVHLFLSLLLSGAMRWDIRRPWLPFADRFVLSAGHTVPLVYATLAVLNETLRARAERSGDPRFAFPDGGRWALTWEDLLKLRRRGGLPGHAEMEGKTLFLKFNTGPSGHGMPPAAGEAVALKLAGAEEVKVFAVEGEGGLTPGASHETRNSAWGLGLSNLVFLVDWNDYGIDDVAISQVVHGTPADWFTPYGWRITGTESGSEWGPVTRAVLEAARGENPERVPSMAWFKTRKGRGYGKYDNKSHGTPHAMNSPEFWAVRREFMERHGVTYAGVDEPAPADPAEREAQARHNFEVAIGVLRAATATVDAISDRLVELGESVPERVPGFTLGGRGAEIFRDARFTDVSAYPEAMWKRPGEKAPNRAALAAWGAWVNATARAEYDRPLMIACSADLAESTNIAGFAKGWEDLPGWGWYDRDANPRGALLPQEITEFTNAGISVGIATVNLADDPFNDFNGFWTACSTYGSFSYLKYGPMRLFSQLAQDCELKVGKVIWVAGHSGPETAEDSRTHFGIFETGVTQLFPEGHVIDLHPWEYNEVPVLLAAALRTSVPIVALHLTRPAVEIPDRAALGMDSHLEAARGAYFIRRASPDTPCAGTVYVQGTMSTANLVKVLPEIERRGLNVRIVAAISPQLFRMQDAAYRDELCSPADRWDGMAITNRAFKLMRDWVDGPIAEEYSLSSDWDNRWRTGGTVDEVIDEAHLGPDHILEAIERYVRDRETRLRRLRELVASVERGHSGP
ncbi:MAG TPA: 1-deoxy-D-xylulose-5-phosphate synthase N-terminal domain-containing protein [candidate division Zixibacteria bacterium]|nr:1-deoxy-D-xylulose-5-phosphate synthase N-terminal domain-containing protein [candidate division Zixibacteria bacterium]